MQPGTAGDCKSLAVPGGPGVVVVVPTPGTPTIDVVTAIAAGLADGCAVIVSMPAESVLTGRQIGDVLAEAGVPEGLVSVLCSTRSVSRYLQTHQDIDHVVVVGADTSRPTSLVA
ncbi:aldehyde dehydrogenase family protein [Pseudarthrobacter sulfonivorans]|uniref:aldehyde dehydrogenase family protein n=1 Tax=Pseudarthrobacter sulfonivorans TaxID=121292 RepID=UPI001CC282AA